MTSLVSMDLTQKKVTIIGAKKSGVAVANLVARLGGHARISDQGTEGSSAKDLEKLSSVHSVVFEWGGHTRAFVEESDLVVLSPGVRSDAPPVQWARAKQIPVLGEIEFAWQFCTKPVVAVTGSNGKTTVSTLIAKVLEQSGKKVVLCGNVGIPFSQQVLDLADKDFVVLEISSFQLETISKFHPQVAVFTNFSQNHLDRHKDLDEYFAAKKRIFLNQNAQDFAVLNYDDLSLRKLAPELKAQIRFFNSPEVLARTSIRNPNQLTALAVGKALGVSEEDCLKVFEEFKGVEHRLEWVRTVEGVHFINDSKATTAEAGRWALQSFDRPIIMICGGRDKNIDFSVLRDLVKIKVKKMFVIGEASDKIKRVFQDCVSLEECSSLEESVRRAQSSAVAGDYVVLSPMCTSFDMFRDFEERGQVYKRIVHDLR